jgi:signal-transduction protein with cAMP-binding, CBS, and nucleotidyltransferase domain
MRVREVLNPQDLLTLPETATAMEAATAMSARKVGAILVVGKDGRLTGIFTERDLMSRVVVERRDPERTALAEVMTREVFSVDPEHPVDLVRVELQRRHIRHLPVVVDGRLVGVLSLRDILRADLDKMSHEVEALENYFLGGSEPQA